MIEQMYPLEKCQKVELPQGAIYLGPSNKEQSVGYLELNPARYPFSKRSVYHCQLLIV